MQRMRREGVESAPGLVPWGGKRRSGTGVFAWCLSPGLFWRAATAAGYNRFFKRAVVTCTCHEQVCRLQHGGALHQLELDALLIRDGGEKAVL